jgi:selenide,water dikinase
MYPGGLERNREFVTPHVRFADSIDAANRGILFEPETSGGLLIALAVDQARSYVAQAQVDGIDARIIGEVADGSGISVE